MKIEHWKHRFFVALACQEKSVMAPDVFDGMAQFDMTLAGYFKDISGRSNHSRRRKAFERLSEEKERYAEILRKRQHALQTETPFG